MCKLSIKPSSFILSLCFWRPSQDQSAQHRITVECQPEHRASPSGCVFIWGGGQVLAEHYEKEQNEMFYF